MDGCCQCCEGKGSDTSCGGLCWDCRGTGHPHIQKPCPTCGGPVPCDTVWIRLERFFCSERCAAKAPVQICYPCDRRESSRPHTQAQEAS